MKKCLFVLCAVSLFTIVACKKSEPGGGQARANQFTIEAPAMTTSIKQGETDNIALKINRGKEFTQAVKLQADAPSGIQVAVHESPVKPNEKDVSLKIAVANNVAPGEHIIKVTGTPDSGAATTLDLKVKVTQKTNGSDRVEMTLKGPLLATSVKQGEAQTIKITVDPADKGDVKLEADAPQGLKTELTPITIKTADKGTANLRVTADKSAALGEHTIRITGSSGGATVKALDVKVKVVAP